MDVDRSHVEHILRTKVNIFLFLPKNQSKLKKKPKVNSKALLNTKLNRTPSMTLTMEKGLKKHLHIYAINNKNAN